MPIIHQGPGYNPDPHRPQNGLPANRKVFVLLGAGGLIGGLLAALQANWPNASMLGGLGLALLAYGQLLQATIRPPWQERGLLALGLVGVVLGMVGAYLLL